MIKSARESHVIEMPNEVAQRRLSPRESGKLIAEQSEDVSIDDAGVEVAAAMLAESFVTEDFSMSSWKKETLHPDVRTGEDFWGSSDCKRSVRYFRGCYFQIANEDAIDFIFLMDTLNFCFWHEDPNRKFKVGYSTRQENNFQIVSSWTQLERFIGRSAFYHLFFRSFMTEKNTQDSGL